MHDTETVRAAVITFSMQPHAAPTLHAVFAAYGSPPNTLAGQMEKANRRLQLYAEQQRIRRDTDERVRELLSAGNHAKAAAVEQEAERSMRSLSDLLALLTVKPPLARRTSTFKGPGHGPSTHMRDKRAGRHAVPTARSDDVDGLAGALQSLNMHGPHTHGSASTDALTESLSKLKFAPGGTRRRQR